MQGVQAQTVANFLLSFEANLSIIPVINKVSSPPPSTENTWRVNVTIAAVQIDLPLADVGRVTEQLHNVFGFSPEEAIQVLFYTPASCHQLYAVDTH